MFFLGYRARGRAARQPADQWRDSMQDTYQPLVPGKDDRVEHWLIEETVAHPLADNDVYLLHRQLHLFHFTLKYGNDWKIRTPRPYFAGILTGNCEHPTSRPDLQVLALFWFYFQDETNLTLHHTLHHVYNKRTESYFHVFSLNILSS